MKNLPDWLQIAEIKIDNRTSFELTNGSQIKASSTSGDAGRSEALSLLIIDEAAHVEGMSELWTGLYPTLSTGGRCIALSTPNGVGNWFHKTYLNLSKQQMIFIQQLCHGMYIQIEIKNGLKKKPETCPADKLHKRLSAISILLVKL